MRLHGYMQVQRALQAPTTDLKMPISEALTALRQLLCRQTLPLSTHQEHEVSLWQSVCAAARQEPNLILPLWYLTTVAYVCAGAMHSHRNNTEGNCLEDPPRWWDACPGLYSGC